MARPRIVSLDEKCEWMRKRQEQRAALEAASPPKKGPSLATIQRTKREVPARFIMYRVAEVADMFGVSPDTIRHWFAGRAMAVALSARKRRRTFLISQQDLDDFINEYRPSA